MSRCSPFVIMLSGADRDVLERRARSYSLPHAVVVRARIVLLAAGGEQNAVIARRLDVHSGVVSKWRKRFALEGLGGLADRKRPGCGVFPAPVVSQVKAMACERRRGGRWRCRGGARRSWPPRPRGRHGGERVGVHVRRWLAEDAIKPWQYRSWIFPRDPDFAAKAGRVLDLYQRLWDGRPLADDEYVISADEKSQLQALSRCHAGLPSAPGRAGRVEFEYERHGTLAYVAAYDVHRARLMGVIAPTTGIAPFTELVTKVMSAEPYASAKRVFWVVDNGSSHAGEASIRRMAQAWPAGRWCTCRCTRPG